MVLIEDPGGEVEAQWVESWRGVLLEREEATLFVPWLGQRRLTWRQQGRRLLLGDRVVAYLWQGLGTRELQGLLRNLGPRLPWLILDAEALVPTILDALARVGALRLGLVCPVARPCRLDGVERLAPVIRALSLKEGWLDTQSLARLSVLGRLEYLSLRGARVPPAFVFHLGRLRRLRALDLAGLRSPVSESSLAPLLARCSALGWLDLSFTGLSLSGRLVAALAPNGAIRTLRLSATRPGRSLLHALAGVPTLRELDLSLTPLGDGATSALGELAGLRALDLRDTSITDFGAPDVARLGCLRLLLAPRGLTDHGLGWLDGLRTLEGLSIGRAAVSDRGPERLRDLPRLRWIEVDGTWASTGRERSSARPIAEASAVQNGCHPPGESP